MTIAAAVSSSHHESARNAPAGRFWAWLGPAAVLAAFWPMFGLPAASLAFFVLSIGLFLGDRPGAVRLFWIAYAADLIGFAYAGGPSLGGPLNLALFAGLAFFGAALTGLSALRLRSRFTRTAV